MKLLLNKENLENYWLLMRFDRPIGIFLLLWPTYWALLIAGEGRPDVLVCIVFTLGVIIMRAAGCVINDYADRKLDPLVKRTKNRPLANGSVRPQEALQLFFGLIVVAFLLVLLMNSLTIILSAVAVFLAGLYPFMKRHTHLPQVFLGMAFGMSVPMAFAAQTGGLTELAGLLFVATVIWAVVYDTMYAMADREDDLKIGVKSTAILFADADKIWIGIFQFLLFLTFYFIGVKAELGAFYLLALSVAAGFSVYQQFLIRNREPDKCLAAFLNNNYLGLAIFLGILADYISASL
jgi:4-hydroxybenzoate polyprenyltransferase